MTYQLSEADIKRIVNATVHETLLTIGVDAKNPLEMQKDFQHMRDFRVATQMVKRRSLATVITILIAGALGALWVGIKSHFN